MLYNLVRIHLSRKNERHSLVAKGLYTLSEVGAKMKKGSIDGGVYLFLLE